MKPYQISQEMHSFCRTFERTVSKPQLGRLKEMMHGILRGQDGILSEMARQNRGKEGKVIRRQVQQYSDMLKKLPLDELLMQKLRGMRSEISGDTPIYYDLVDITKRYHAGLDQIGTTWDGSEGMPGKGYEMIDVSLSHGDYAVTLWRHLYSTAEDGYRSELMEMESMLKIFHATWGGILGTWFFDEGNDSDKKVALALDYEMTFVIRMNVNRGAKDRIVEIEEEEKVKMMGLWGEKAQGMTTWQGQEKRGRRRLVPLQWRRIIWNHNGERLSLYLVWCHRKGDPRPAVFLTSRKIEDEAAAAKVYHEYFNRGKEEAGFKKDKTKLGMEKVQLRSLEKIRQLMKVYVLVDQLLSRIYLNSLKREVFIHDLLKGFLAGTQRTITKWAIVDWYDDLHYHLEREMIRFRRRYPPAQATSQLSLFPSPIKKW